MDPKRLSASLLTASGALFFVAGLLRGFQEPIWLVLGAALLAVGIMLLRRMGGP